MKLRVQQLIQSLTAAPNSGVVEFDFEGLEFLKEGFHVECSLYGLALELTGGHAKRCSRAAHAVRVGRRVKLDRQNRFGSDY
jgi:hypothetical protein